MRTFHSPAATLVAGCAASLIACSDDGGSRTQPDPDPFVVLISNLEGMENSDISLNAAQGRSAAVGFTMPAQPHTLDTLNLKFRTLEAPEPESLVVRLFDNNAEDNPGTALLSFITPTIPANAPSEVFPFMPEESFTLEANTTYWVVAYFTGTGSPGWTSGNPSLVPTGVADHFGAKFNPNVLPDPPTTDSDFWGQYAIVGRLRDD